jgi:hypothetical protein
MQNNSVYRVVGRFFGRLNTCIGEYIMKELYHTYAKDGKYAEVFKTEQGWEVDLFTGTELIETRKVHNHSESYAEDVADNWVHEILKVEKEGSFYGYNEKNNNFYPGLDD